MTKKNLQNVKQKSPKDSKILTANMSQELLFLSVLSYRLRDGKVLQNRESEGTMRTWRVTEGETWTSALCSWCLQNICSVALLFILNQAGAYLSLCIRWCGLKEDEGEWKWRSCHRRSVCIVLLLLRRWSSTNACHDSCCSGVTQAS